MRLVKIYRLAAAMCLAAGMGFTSCIDLTKDGNGDGDEGEQSGILNFEGGDIDNLQIYAQGDTVEIAFEAKDTWTTTLQLTSQTNNTSWIKRDQKAGAAGQALLKVFVSPNYTRETRSADLSITCGSEKKVINILQTDRNEDGKYPLYHKKITGLDITPEVSGGSYSSREILFDYDEKGRLGRMTEKIDDGEDMQSYCDYVYADNTMTLENKVSGYEDMGSYNVTYTLDDNGYAVHCSDPEADFEYDNEGRLSKITYYPDNGDIYEHYVTFDWDYSEKRLYGYTEYRKYLDYSPTSDGRVETEEWTKCNMQYIGQVGAPDDKLLNFYTINLMSILYGIEGIVPADIDRFGMHSDEIPICARFEIERQYADGQWMISTDNRLTIEGDPDHYCSSWGTFFGGGVGTYIDIERRMLRFSMYSQKTAYDDPVEPLNYEIRYEGEDD